MQASIKKKILIYFITSTIPLMLVLLWLIRIQISHTNIPLTRDLNEQVLYAKADQMGEWIDKRICELKIISEMPQLKNMEEDMDEARDFMIHMDQINKENFESFALVDLNGHAWVTNNTYIDIGRRAYFKSLKGEKLDYTVSDPIISHSNKVPIVVITYPIKNYEDEIIYYINGAIYLERFSEIARQVELYDGKAWFSDSQGNIFTYTDSGLKSIEEVIGDNKVTIYSKIPNTQGWNLGIDFSRSLMTQDTDNLLYTILIFGIFMIILSILLSFYISKSISNPIIELQGAMEDVDLENLKPTFKFKNSSRDEISKLADSFNLMLEKIDRLLKQLELEYRDKSNWELKVLHSQIQPHFLYNSLDTIKWSIIEEDYQESIDLLEILSTYYRIGLSRGKEYIRIEEELDHIDSYLQIQKARYEGKLDYLIRYDEDILDYRILKLILQPIVENSILHGFKNKTHKNFQISISIQKHERGLEILVEDNGLGISEDDIKKLNNILRAKENKSDYKGFGLFSTDRRIRLGHGDNYGIEIYRENNTTTVKICYPILLEEDLEEDYSENSNSR